MQPSLVFPIAVLVSAAVWGTLRKQLAWWDLTVFVVGGVYVLEYGFTNIGLTGAGRASPIRQTAYRPSPLVKSRCSVC